MGAFPGRFPNEIVNDLDLSLFARVNAAQRIEAIEASRREWLRPGSSDDLTTADWEAIREHDRLIGDYTVKVVQE